MILGSCVFIGVCIVAGLCRVADKTGAAVRDSDEQFANFIEDCEGRTRPQDTFFSARKWEVQA